MNTCCWHRSIPPRRPYVSPLREQGATRTRELILRHATELFAERGYGRVTVAGIASAAGVASKAVFSSVGSKNDILNRRRPGRGRLRLRAGDTGRARPVNAGEGPRSAGTRNASAQPEPVRRARGDPQGTAGP
ncbi:TetR/AcrR family transcriptional regulator [Streptomyces sp. NPDC059837]|uniref:TetR/AcrR family transcriptional regulator n=1 Tax=Streptomyces sp. NPDC059837 TaxID=3346968 RepID=UPI0036570CA5